jgi:hypothetical protein
MKAHFVTSSSRQLNYTQVTEVQILGNNKRLDTLQCQCDSDTYPDTRNIGER